MNKFVLIVLALVLSAGCLRAQNSYVMTDMGYLKPVNDSVVAVKSVAGCNFGDEKLAVVTKLTTRFGKRPYENTNNVLGFDGVEIGGKKYDYVEFFFKYNSTSGRSELVSAQFQKRFFTFEEEAAKAWYGNVVSQYSRKYTNLHSSDDRGDFMASTCGATYTAATGEARYPIIITCEKTVSRGGEMYYFVLVNYFMETRNNMYDDDI